MGKKDKKAETKKKSEGKASEGKVEAKGSVRESRRSSFFRKFIDTKLGRTHYILRGSDDGELVVFLHGLTKYSYIFDDLGLAVDEAQHRALAFDFYGRGFSDAAKGGPKMNVQFYVDQTVDVLQELGLWLESFTLVGFSMGAAVAAEFAKQHPSKVKRLALISPAGLNMTLSPGGTATRIPVFGLIGAQLFGKGAIADYDATYDFHNVDSEANEEPIRIIQEKTEFQINTKESAFVNSVVKTIYHFEWAGLEKTFREIGQHKRPALVMWAKNDKQLPIAGAAKLKALMPNANIVEVNECGHQIPQEKPLEVRDALLKLIQSNPLIDASAPEEATPTQRRMSVTPRLV